MAIAPLRPSIRVLVVDDSRLMREMICDLVQHAPRMEVVGQAGDGPEALKKLAEIDVDVVTLDVQMPGMDGLQVLEQLIQRRPVPTVMVSAVTQRDAAATLAALELGAVDYVAKPDGMGWKREDFGGELLHKIRIAAGADVRRMLTIRKSRGQRVGRPIAPPRPPVSTAPCRQERLQQRCVAIGISTGGPPALARLFEALRPPLPPIVVAQHMPANFTGPFAERLNGLSRLTITEAAAGCQLRPNEVLIAPGGKHLRVVRRGGALFTEVNERPPVSGHRPSVDVLMASVAEAAPGQCLGVIMTGMGRDGVDGCGAICRAGGYVLGQDQETSDVYGMNKAALRAGNVHEQFALEELARRLSELARGPSWKRTSATC